MEVISSDNLNRAGFQQTIMISNRDPPGVIRRYIAMRFWRDQLIAVTVVCKCPVEPWPGFQPSKFLNPSLATFCRETGHWQSVSSTLHSASLLRAFAYRTTVVFKLPSVLKYSSTNVAGISLVLRSSPTVVVLETVTIQGHFEKKVKNLHGPKPLQYRPKV